MTCLTIDHGGERQEGEERRESVLHREPLSELLLGPLAAIDLYNIVQLPYLPFLYLMHLKAIENFYVRGIVQVLLSNGPIYWQRVICGRDNVCF